MKLRSEVNVFCVHIDSKSKSRQSKLVHRYLFIINMRFFAELLMHVIKLFINISTDFVTSHKIAFFSKLYDIDLLEICTHDRTYITLYVYEFPLNLHQHSFWTKKAPRTTLRCSRL